MYAQSRYQGHGLIITSPSIHWYMIIIPSASIKFFFSKFQNLNFGQIFQICNFGFVLFWLGIWYESIVWGSRGYYQNSGILVHPWINVYLGNISDVTSLIKVKPWKQFAFLGYQKCSCLFNILFWVHGQILRFYIIYSPKFAHVYLRDSLLWSITWLLHVSKVTLKNSSKLWKQHQGWPRPRPWPCQLGYQ